MDKIEQRVTEIKAMDDENEADSRLEDDQVIEVINMVKDDLLMVVEMKDNGRISHCLEQEQRGLGNKSDPEDTAHTIPWTRREVCTVSRQSQTNTPWGWGLCRLMHVLPYRCTYNFSSTRHTKSIHKHGSPDFASQNHLHGFGGGCSKYRKDDWTLRGRWRWKGRRGAEVYQTKTKGEGGRFQARGVTW